MINFTPREDCNYLYDYADIFAFLAEKEASTGKKQALEIKQQHYRGLILNDLFFIVCFVMGIEKANRPFVVNQCREVQFGPSTDTLDVWARGHFKSAIITQAETLQFHLKNPEKCTGILAYARPPAKAFLRSIKILCEESQLLKWCFPDILWNNPASEAPKWSEDDGLIFKRQSSARKESTIEAWGLIEGMPTGRHFERLIFDDIETDDIKDSPEMLDKVFSKFEMAGNLGTMSDDDIVRVIGTYYSHFGPIVRIGEMVFPGTDDKIYHLRKVPATDDGTIKGKPVLLDQKAFEKAKAGQHFNSQQLCDPTPTHEVKLSPSFLKPIEPEFIPRNVYKFLVVDQAGDDNTNKAKGDLWAYGIFGVKPKTDEIGASDVYIMDLEADQMGHSEAIDGIVRMYMNGGIIRQLGIEKVGLSTTEIHIQNALRAQGRRLSEEHGNLVLLKPAGRSLAKRIEAAVQWPLLNGKIYYSTSIPKKLTDRLRLEMEKFPYFHSDILNIIAYLYDMLSGFRFPKGTGQKKDLYEGVFLR